MYVRLRVDPELIRISVRKFNSERDWRVAVRYRETPEKSWRLFDCFCHPNIKIAIDLALRRAASRNLPGMNLELRRAFTHPQFPE